jgi:hypothetical protein
MMPNGLLPYVLPILAPRSRLVGYMRPAADRKLNPGEFTYIAGPGIHAGPESEIGEYRVVLFFTTYLKGYSVRYDTNTQLLPYNITIAINSAHLFVRVLREWMDERGWNFTREWVTLGNFVANMTHDGPRCVAYLKQKMTEVHGSEVDAGSSS